MYHTDLQKGILFEPAIYGSPTSVQEFERYGVLWVK